MLAEPGGGQIWTLDRLGCGVRLQFGRNLMGSEVQTEHCWVTVGLEKNLAAAGLRPNSVRLQSVSISLLIYY